MEKQLLTFGERSDLPGKPMFYETTKKFLEIFSLRNLSELPSLSEIDQLIPEGIGEVEDKESLSDLTGALSKEAGASYSEGEDELLKITDELTQIATSSDFFEQEKQRARERRDFERARDLREAMTVGETIEDKDRRWLERYDQAQTEATAAESEVDFVAQAQDDATPAARRRGRAAGGRSRAPARARRRSLTTHAFNARSPRTRRADLTAASRARTLVLYREATLPILRILILPLFILSTARAYADTCEPSLTLAPEPAVEGARTMRVFLRPGSMLYIKVDPGARAAASSAILYQALGVEPFSAGGREYLRVFEDQDYLSRVLEHEVLLFCGEGSGRMVLVNERQEQLGAMTALTEVTGRTMFLLERPGLKDEIVEQPMVAVATFARLVLDRSLHHFGLATTAARP